MGLIYRTGLPFLMILTSHLRTKPSSLGKTLSILAIGLLVRPTLLSLINTTSPICRLFFSFNHFFQGCKVCKYSRSISTKMYRRNVAPFSIVISTCLTHQVGSDVDQGQTCESVKWQDTIFLGIPCHKKLV